MSSQNLHGKILAKPFFSYFSQLLLMSSFFAKGNFCEIENSRYFEAVVEMVYFLEYHIAK